MTETSLSIQLRPASAEEYALCVQLLHSADEDDNRIRAAMDDPTNTTYLAYDGTRAVGAAMLRWDAAEAELVYIGVAEAAQGRGIGKQMVAALTAQVRLRNIAALVVGTANSSIDNIIFYQKCGFRMDHVRRDYFSYLPQPVVENGIPMRDMIVFRLVLD